MPVPSPLPVLPLGVLRLLRQSWQDIGYRYEGLTREERACISAHEFRQVLGQVLYSPRRGDRVTWHNGTRVLFGEYTDRDDKGNQSVTALLPDGSLERDSERRVITYTLGPDRHLYPWAPREG